MIAFGESLRSLRNTNNQCHGMTKFGKRCKNNCSFGCNCKGNKCGKNCGQYCGKHKK